MFRTTAKALFLADLRARIEAHQAQVERLFLPLTEAQLAWQPAPNQWSILQCFDHLNETHAFYLEKISRPLRRPRPLPSVNGVYRPSFWARLYLSIAFNPRLSFPTPARFAPGSDLQPMVLRWYQEYQQVLLGVLQRAATVDLCRTRVLIVKRIRFNLGDCLRLLVVHDDLHIQQVLGVLAQFS